MPEDYSSREIIALRSAKNRVDPFVPYHFLHEKEPGLSGGVETVNTIFLSSKECAFKCLMCDLWKNTLDDPPPAGAILKQIDYALDKLPAADVIKLYNNGNFFDAKAIAPSDYPAMAERLEGYKRVIVENHPSLCQESCIAFSEMLEGKLEIAMGLESIHPKVLPRLNKQINLDDFEKAARFLDEHGIDTRCFILLNPPYLTDATENIKWTVRAIEFAFDCGVKRCAVIPVRAGNGVMDQLWKEGNYTPPTLAALETVFEKGLSLRKGQVFVDTWDIEFLSNCPHCFSSRKERLGKMNLHQEILPGIQCECQQAHA